MTTYLRLKSLYSIRSLVITMIIGMFVITSIVVLPKISSADTTIPLCEITRNLKVGDTGLDVQCLQRYLNWAGYTVSSTGFGSPGNESVYFGPLTASAVTRWQNANASKVLLPAGLSSGTGYFGPLSFGWYVSLVRIQLDLPA
ncbi:MAG: hypothetical protein AB201_00915 [Parcubacteria bacterium C7867-006]|nr:MAG: hypothetical protein AB201_00915 [Parcubacteria bacterium C7867-006]